MARQIVLTYEGKEYTLEFNRRIVKRMEESGFKVDKDTPYTMVTELFKGAFQMHHRKLPADTIEDIWDAQTQKEKLLSALVGMYMQPIADLMEDAEGDEENPTWKEV